ncbi:MAG: signal peptidase II [Myxococcota bacterium]
MKQLRLTTFAIVLAACIGCDQAAKQAAGALLGGGERVALLGDAVRFELVSNPGAFLSLGAGLPEALRSTLLIGLVPVLLGCVLFGFVWRAQATRGELVAVALVIGGGIGNWLDRLTHGGAVTDFVSVGLGPLRTGIFNLADVAVMVGVALLLLCARAAPRAR